MRTRILLYAFLSLSLFTWAQEQPKPAEQPAKPPLVSASARLNAAKTVYIRNGGGSPIPYNAISSGFEGWGRFVVVDDPAKADLIVEVTSPASDSGVSISSSTMTGARREETVSSSRALSASMVKMLVIDNKTKTPLWSGMEQAKSGMRKKSQEDNLVEAGEKLFTKFHDRLEPPPAQ